MAGIRGRQNQILGGVGGSIFITLVLLPAYFIYVVEDTKRNLAFVGPRPEPVNFKQLVYDRRMMYRKLLEEDKKKS